jgi:hypothetical protein
LVFVKDAAEDPLSSYRCVDRHDNALGRIRVAVDRGSDVDDAR